MDEISTLINAIAERDKYIAELEARLPADTLQAVCDTQRKQIEELEQERYNALYENAHLKHRIAALEWEWEEPRSRPVQGGWLEKDTLTGEVHEPNWQRREREET